MGLCRFTYRTDQLPILQEAGCAGWPVGGTNYLTSTGIRSPDRQLIASRCTTYSSAAVLIGVDEQQNGCAVWYELLTDAGFQLKDLIS